MDHVARPSGGDNASKRLRVERVGDGRRRAERAQLRLICREARERGDLMSGGHERAHQRDADRPGSSCKKYVHDVLLAARNAERTPIATPADSLTMSSAAVTANTERHCAATWSMRSGPGMTK